MPTQRLTAQRGLPRHRRDRSLCRADLVIHSCRHHLCVYCYRDVSGGGGVAWDMEDAQQSNEWRSEGWKGGELENWRCPERGTDTCSTSTGGLIMKERGRKSLLSATNNVVALQAACGSKPPAASAWTAGAAAARPAAAPPARRPPPAGGRPGSGTMSSSARPPTQDQPR